MIPIPEEFKELLREDNLRKNLRVSFPNHEHADIINKDIIADSVSFTESLCSRDSFKFGLCESNKIEFECILDKNIKGTLIDVDLEIDATDISIANNSVLNYAVAPSQGYFTTTPRFMLRFYGDFTIVPYSYIRDVREYNYISREIKAPAGHQTYWDDYPYVERSEKNKILITKVEYMLQEHWGMTNKWEVLCDIDEPTRINSFLKSYETDANGYYTSVTADFGENITKKYRDVKFRVTFNKKDGACYVINHRLNGIKQVTDLDYEKVYPITYGKFIVDSCDRVTSAMERRKIVAYSPNITDVNLIQPLYWTGISPLERAKMDFKCAKCDYVFELSKFIYSNIPFMGYNELTYKPIDDESGDPMLETEDQVSIEITNDLPIADGFHLADEVKIVIHVRRIYFDIKNYTDLYALANRRDEIYEIYNKIMNNLKNDCRDYISYNLMNTSNALPKVKIDDSDMRSDIDLFDTFDQYLKDHPYNKKYVKYNQFYDYISYVLDKVTTPRFYLSTKENGKGDVIDIDLNHNETFIYPYIKLTSKERNRAFKPYVSTKYDKKKITRCFIQLPTAISIQSQDSYNDSDSITTYQFDEDVFTILKTDIDTRYKKMNMGLARTQLALTGKDSKYYTCKINKDNRPTTIKTYASYGKISKEEYDDDRLKTSSEIYERSLNIRQLVEGFLELHGKFGKWSREENMYGFTDVDSFKFLYPRKIGYKDPDLLPFVPILPHKSSNHAIILPTPTKQSTYLTLGNFSLSSSTMLAAKRKLENTYYRSLWWDDVLTKPYSRVSCTFKNLEETPKENEDDTNTEEEVEETQIIIKIAKDYVLNQDGRTYTTIDYDDDEDGADELKVIKYDITGNWLVDNIPMKESTIRDFLKDLASKLSRIRFMPMDVNMQGLIYIESGDWLEIHLPDEGDVIYTPVLSRTLKGIQALEDDISSK